MLFLRTALLSTLLIPACFVPAAAVERPNIVVILCDDLGYGDLECYGHPHIKTPNLNKLAETGIRFTDCYSAAAVCSPSRVGLLTGRSPNRAGVYDWIPPSNGTRRPDSRDQVHLRKHETTIASLLQQAGYATCMSGKWHCNSRFNHASQPQPGDFGFDHWFATQNNASPTHDNPTNFIRNGTPVGPTSGFSCQLVVDEVIQWLDTRDQAQQPFFAYVSFHEPHEPIASPAELVDTYRKFAKTENEAKYFANVTNVDLAVGRLVHALEQRQVRKNTLIVFTSDNGPETLRRYQKATRSYGRATPLRGMKLHTHEAGFRVAGIANWPENIAPKQTSSSVISSLDFLPTFCKLAGATIPAELQLDGQDGWPAFSGQSFQRKKPLVWSFFNATNMARIAMRHERFKVLAQLDGGRLPKIQNIHTANLKSIQNAKLTDFEIYDVTQDIGESQNLYQVDSEQTKELCALLTAEYQQLLADSHVWPTPRTTWATKLGWKPTDKVLILHADDIGMCYEANLAAKRYLKDGNIQSAALMVPCPWYNEMAEWYTKNPTYDLGLHLALTSEWKTYRWGPVADRTKVPGLIDEQNYLWHDVQGVAIHATPEEVERELRAQIQKALEAGPKPGHIDTHMGTLFARADYTQVYLKLAEEFQIPAMVVENTPEVMAKFREQGYPLDDRMIEVMADYQLPKLDDFHSVESATNYDEKKQKFIQLVRSMRPGINEVIFHPSVESEGLAKITGSWQQRIWEARMFADPEIIRFLEIEKVKFTNWKEIMHRFGK